MNARRGVTTIALTLILGLIFSMWTFVQTLAQSYPAGVSIDSFTFFIPYPAEMLDDQFDAGYAGASLIGNDIETTISIAVHRSGSIIFYDHWEDGLESSLTMPIQPTTQIWGDDNPDNGIPPNFSTDVLSSGDVLILRNVVALDGAGRRDPAELFFDGGDALISVNGSVAVTLAVWPEGPGILYAGAWPLYPTNRWGTDFRIPVGTDLASLRPGFTVVGLNVQAVQNETRVQLDLDADGSFEEKISLARGQQFTSINGVRVGAQLQASDPVQVQLLTANPASEYEARAYTIFPFSQSSDDIIAPRSSDGDFWLYNPHDSTLEISVQTFTSTSVITVPADSTVKYPPVGLSGPTGARFTSSDQRTFTGVAALDETDSQDWGYALLPLNRLTTQTLIGLGLGNNVDPPGPDSSIPGSTGFESRVYVTAEEDTTVYVDYDNDGSRIDSFPVRRLEEVSITDPVDYNMTGAFLYTDDGTPFIAVWGQDESANPADPSIDVGTSIVPLPSLVIQKTVGPLLKDADCTGTITLGDTIQFNLHYFNNSVGPINDVILEDDLPSSVTYVPNSTVVDGVVIPDNGNTPFPLDEGGYYAGTLAERGSGSLTFEAVINNDSELIINWSYIRSDDLPLGSDFAVVFCAPQEPIPLLEVNKALIDPSVGPAISGQVITFGLNITNTSPITITSLPLQDTFNEDHLTFIGASPIPDEVVSGAIAWNDLTTLFGHLSPGAIVSTTVSFVVDELPSTITHIQNFATVLEAERSDNLPPLICHDVARVEISTPTPPTPPTEPVIITVTQTATPTETATPTQTASATPTATLPVTLLPETGVLSSTQAGKILGGFILLSVILVVIVVGMVLTSNSRKMTN